LIAAAVPPLGMDPAARADRGTFNGHETQGRSRTQSPAAGGEPVSAEGPSPTAPGPSFEERFAALEREWRQLLPAKLQEALRRMQACRTDPADAAELEELHRLLHTLAGSAGTFGLHDVGSGARAIEHELDRVMALPARSGADFDAADRALQALVASAPGG
jgi:HPt (histidine-containing phosphotransfer) domain-containing protein